MTILQEDIDQFEATTEGFKYQPGPQDCLPVCVKNILDELADRHGQAKLRYSESDIKQMSEYDPDWGSTARLLVPNLSTELQGIGYTVKDHTNMEFAELQNIIQSSTASYPTVSVSSEYFDFIKNWDPRGSRRGKNRTHMLIPFKINSEEILFFDPYGQMQLRSGAVSAQKLRLDREDFFRLWDTEKAFPRYALWIDKQDQSTLDAYA